MCIMVLNSKILSVIKWNIILVTIFQEKQVKATFFFAKKLTIFFS